MSGEAEKSPEQLVYDLNARRMQETGFGAHGAQSALLAQFGPEVAMDVNSSYQTTAATTPNADVIEIMGRVGQLQQLKAYEDNAHGTQKAA